ncbi:MAG: 3-oxoacyl-ACP reductase FabG [Victivallales bacterium]|nr:3-oxoacyl-ACP reductase FabG [Victivallales bacterium]
MIQYSFQNRVAVVTGGTRGIGAAVTRGLLQGGATVIALYASNGAAAQAFRDSLGDLAGALTVVPCDVADYAAVESFFQEFDKTHPALDILVNSAGIRQDGVLAMMPREKWDKVLDVDLGGCFNMFKLGVQRMLPRRYGRIIGITSLSGRMGIEGQANYAAAKAGQVAMVKSLSKEVARRKITVNCVAPGFIATDFIAALPPEQAAAYQATVPLRRFGTAEEVAAAVLFLASEEAAYITGSVIEVAGGL